ncbi:MAG TPA: FAD-binding protein [Planctomycetes bacterium]|nr:FAD-binding protein [Planctomycetota bacterium]HIN79688.1 FAD-binding protein [Planctomycetota bacterium]
MALICHDIRLPLGGEDSDLIGIVARRLRVSPETVRSVEVHRKSLDCRGGEVPRFIYSLIVELPGRVEAHLLGRKGAKVRRWQPFSSPEVIPIADGIPRPVIVGTGPAGLFACWRLVESGVSPIVLERGPKVIERSKRWKRFIDGGDFDPESNLVFGEGGAGTYSDGKLYTRVKDSRVREVLQALVDCGAPGEILTDGRPHVGSNLLPSIVKRMRVSLEEKGAEFFFEHRLADLIIDDDPDRRSIAGVLVETDGEQQRWPAEAVFLATGHSARDVYRMLASHAVTMSQKPFQLGVRVEHPQSAIDRMQYGESAGHPDLPPADYNLVSKRSGDDVFSFCMCPGGEILPSTEREGYLCVNGASKFQRKSPWANSGFVVTLEPDRFGSSSDPLAGIDLQEQIEGAAFEAAGGDFSVPALRLIDFIEGRTSEDLPQSSYPRKMKSTPFENFLPRDILETLRIGLTDLVQRFPEFGDRDALVTAPESRSSSPVRIDRDRDTFESIGLGGLYPLGEGAGFAGGILSAAIDGMKAAEKWMSKTTQISQF